MALYNNVELLDLLRERGADTQRQALAMQRARTAGDAVLHLLNTILDPTILNKMLNINPSAFYGL